MKLSRTVTYALKATLQLVQDAPTRPVPCSRLAAQGVMPERFLLQILRSLVTHGILRSTHGVEGGYMLQKAPEDISVLDVIEAIEGTYSHEVSLGEGLTEITQKRVTSLVEDVCETMRRKLASVKLSELIDASAPTCTTTKEDATVTARIDPPAGANSSPIPTPVTKPQSDVLGTNLPPQPLPPNSGASL